MFDKTLCHSIPGCRTFFARVTFLCADESTFQVIYPHTGEREKESKKERKKGGKEERMEDTLL